MRDALPTQPTSPVTSLTTPLHVHGPLGDLPSTHPVLPLDALDTLWIQVAGTVCNIACLHCFISCGPKNNRHPMMTVAQVDRAIQDGLQHGVKEFYFTGGEPFIHPEIFSLIERTLVHGPLTILTNGIPIDRSMAHRLREIFDRERYSLDLRVSLDGTDAATNDPIRGRGTFDKILAAIEALAEFDLNPVLTVTEVEGVGTCDRDAFRDLLRARGVRRPRTKFLAPFLIGREARRSDGYDPTATLSAEDLGHDASDLLQCGSCRAVTANGVYPCPILIDEPGARMGAGVRDALRPIALNHPACVTCWVEGISCRT